MNTYLRHQIFIFTALLLAGSIFTGAASARSKETLIITGTGSSIGVMVIMARDFQSKHPKVSVKVLPSIGSTGGIKAVQAEKIDIGLSARSLKPEERRAEIIEEPYGRIAFIFGVQGSNPAKGITLAEIEAFHQDSAGPGPMERPYGLSCAP
jgi:phosphate transport system substrate-binding protein